ncbi:elongation factor P hydroxylase [Oleiphilus messinensis]|nr:elongation factor P hydroxylase [Oleiphilus messinensis]
MTAAVSNLIELFNQSFETSYRTVLEAGNEEPIYLPANIEIEQPDLAHQITWDSRRHYHRVVFAHGFFQSAIHEISHWCIAGPSRRTRLDYGYWYEPDGRNAAQQQAFERVEIKPQALEWIFCLCAGVRFRVSIDNLSGERSPTERVFKLNIVAQARSYLQQGLPDRAEMFAEKLKTFYNTASLDLNKQLQLDAIL